MIVQDIAVNRAERIRYRAFNHNARKGDLKGYWRLVALSLEAHSIQEA